MDLFSQFLSVTRTDFVSPSGRPSRARKQLRRIAGLTVALVSLLLVQAVRPPIAHAATGTITEFPLPSNGTPNDLVTGPNKTLWFTETNGNAIGRMTLNGSVTEFSLPSAQSYPVDITLGWDGNFWFTEEGAQGSTPARIGRITPSGQITEFLLPSTPGVPIKGPFAIKAGLDGNVWFTERDGNAIGRITPGGQITEFPLPNTLSEPNSLVVGLDGALWFTEGLGDRIGRITTSGQITEFPLPPPPPGLGSWGSAGIAVGWDGNLWFTEESANEIGQMTYSGQVTEFPIPTIHTDPRGIVAGLDGNLWFTEEYTNAIGRITTSGQVTEFPLPTANSDPHGIVSGPDGNIWFTEYREFQNGQIGQILIS